jgi:hypothetical protein
MAYRLWLLFGEWDRDPPLPYEINPGAASYSVTFHQRVSDVVD